MSGFGSFFPEQDENQPQAQAQAQAQPQALPFPPRLTNPPPPVGAPEYLPKAPWEMTPEEFIKATTPPPPSAGTELQALKSGFSHGLSDVLGMAAGFGRLFGGMRPDATEQAGPMAAGAMEELAQKQKEVPEPGPAVQWLEQERSWLMSQAAPPFGYGSSFAYQTGRILGNFLPYIALGATGGEAGMAASLVGMFGQSYDESFKTAKRYGASSEDAHSAAAINALAQTGLASIPIGDLVSSVPPALRTTFLDSLKDTIRQGMKTAAIMTGVGAADQVADNLTAKVFYDPNRSIADGLKDALGPNAAAGFLMGAITGFRPPVHPPGEEYSLDFNKPEQLPPPDLRGQEGAGVPVKPGPPSPPPMEAGAARNVPQPVPLSDLNWLFAAHEMAKQDPSLLASLKPPASPFWEKSPEDVLPPRERPQFEAPPTNDPLFRPPSPKWPDLMTKGTPPYPAPPEEASAEPERMVPPERVHDVFDSTKLFKDAKLRDPDQLTDREKILTVLKNSPQWQRETSGPLRKNGIVYTNPKNKISLVVGKDNVYYVSHYKTDPERGKLQPLPPEWVQRLAQSYDTRVKGPQPPEPPIPAGLRPPWSPEPPAPEAIHPWGQIPQAAEAKPEEPPAAEAPAPEAHAPEAPAPEAPAPEAPAPEVQPQEPVAAEEPAPKEKPEVVEASAPEVPPAPVEEAKPEEKPAVDHAEVEEARAEEKPAVETTAERPTIAAEAEHPATVSEPVPAEEERKKVSAPEETPAPTEEPQPESRAEEPQPEPPVQLEKPLSERDVLDAPLLPPEGYERPKYVPPVEQKKVTGPLSPQEKERLYGKPYGLTEEAAIDILRGLFTGKFKDELQEKLLENAPNGDAYSYTPLEKLRSAAQHDINAERIASPKGELFYNKKNKSAILFDKDWAYYALDYNPRRKFKMDNFRPFPQEIMEAFVKVFDSGVSSKVQSILDKEKKDALFNQKIGAIFSPHPVIAAGTLEKHIQDVRPYELPLSLAIGEKIDQRGAIGYTLSHSPDFKLAEGAARFRFEFHKPGGENNESIQISKEGVPRYRYKDITGILPSGIKDEYLKSFYVVKNASDSIPILPADKGERFAEALLPTGPDVYESVKDAMNAFKKLGIKPQRESEKGKIHFVISSLPSYKQIEGPLRSSPDKEIYVNSNNGAAIAFSEKGDVIYTPNIFAPIKNYRMFEMPEGIKKRFIKIYDDASADVFGKGQPPEKKNAEIGNKNPQTEKKPSKTKKEVSKTEKIPALEEPVASILNKPFLDSQFVGNAWFKMDEAQRRYKEFADKIDPWNIPLNLTLLTHFVREPENKNEHLVGFNIDTLSPSIAIEGGEDSVPISPSNAIHFDRVISVHNHNLNRVFNVHDLLTQSLLRNPIAMSFRGDFRGDKWYPYMAVSIIKDFNSMSLTVIQFAKELQEVANTYLDREVKRGKEAAKELLSIGIMASLSKTLGFEYYHPRMKTDLDKKYDKPYLASIFSVLSYFATSLLAKAEGNVNLENVNPNETSYYKTSYYKDVKSYKTGLSQRLKGMNENDRKKAIEFIHHLNSYHRGTFSWYNDIFSPKDGKNSFEAVSEAIASFIKGNRPQATSRSDRKRNLPKDNLFFTGGIGNKSGREEGIDDDAFSAEAEKVLRDYVSIFKHEPPRSYAFLDWERKLLEWSKTVPRIGTTLHRGISALFDIKYATQMVLAPMSVGTEDTQRIAKHTANLLREARYESFTIIRALASKFTPEQRRRMWEAANRESEARQLGIDPGTEGLNGLSLEEKTTVEALQNQLLTVYNRARQLGMFRAESLPSYTPRVFDDQNNLIRDISVIPYVMGMLREAVHTRELIEFIRNYKVGPQQDPGAIIADQTTEEVPEEMEEEPAEKEGPHPGLFKAPNPAAEALNRFAYEFRAGTPQMMRRFHFSAEESELAAKKHAPKRLSEYFTLPEHPAFSVWEQTPYRGRYHRYPIRIHRVFEGPLRAILGGKQGALYRGLIELKSRMMTSILFGMGHFFVIASRALPVSPRLVKMALDGNALRKNTNEFQKFLGSGLVPITRDYGFLETESLQRIVAPQPGRSWTANIAAAILSAPVRLVDKGAAQKISLAVKQSIDRLGQIMHETLLWDRVADLQAGLAQHFYQKAKKKGLDDDAALIVSSHMANLLTGALPRESMSEGARKVLNAILFSRSYTMSSLGVIKSAVQGLPIDLQRMIESEQRKTANNFARRLALGILLTDFTMYSVLNNALQSAADVALMAHHNVPVQEAVQQEMQTYVDDLQRELKEGQDIKNPIDIVRVALSPHIGPMSHHERTKEHRILVGFEPNGRAVYVRMPFGKSVEDIIGFFTDTYNTIRNKASPFIRPLITLYTARDDLGRAIYDPYGDTSEKGSQVARYVANMIMNDVLPMETIKGAMNVLEGQATPEDYLRMAGQLFGMTVSHGYPGGPAMSEINAYQQSKRWHQQQTRQEIRELLRLGKTDEAVQKMTEAGFTPRQIEGELRRGMGAPLSFPRMLEMVQKMSPEQQKKFFDLLEYESRLKGP